MVEGRDWRDGLQPLSPPAVICTGPASVNWWRSPPLDEKKSLKLEGAPGHRSAVFADADKGSCS
jgi:hypothetical protein